MEIQGWLLEGRRVPPGLRLPVAEGCLFLSVWLLTMDLQSSKVSLSRTWSFCAPTKGRALD